MATRAKDQYTRQWIINNSLDIISNYDDGILTLRGLHYQLVALGMTNTIQHYKRVVAAMKKARWEGLVSFETFSDHDRSVLGMTIIDETILDNEVERAQGTIEYIMENYHKNRWENQPYFIEVWIEKKALQGVFQAPCRNHEVALAPCKGYPSLTFLNEATDRFRNAMDQDKKAVILYFGDYDASGEDIPRSIQESLYDFGVDVAVQRVALMEEQVLEMQLPPAPTKKTDSRAKNWTGLGQVELDAVKPEILQMMCEQAIRDLFNEELYEELMQQQEKEKESYVIALKKFVNNLKEE
ncbi:hypothetical protein [Aureispira anguillae]|uniref:DUF2399 domain-containing protein n=1 Tax=Aureispira anguillae TaxID=2864201 RepID=A0A916DSM3_9BACT|nr:hypothetical protein [Aureispira anguillae]BDS10901.1 hypothetical protein AsAng_0016110 [Aureispira anguillae]